MNLDNATNLSPIQNLFYEITAVTFVLIFVLFFSIFAYLKFSGILPSRIPYKGIQPNKKR